MSKDMSLREKIQFYMINCKTLPGKLIDLAIIFFNLLICLLFVLETYPISQSTHNILWKLELFIVSLFIIEYMARLYGSKNRWKQVFNIYSIIDVITILPTIIVVLLPAASASISIIKLMRVFRIFRIFRFLRFAADPEFFFGNITAHLLKVVQLLLTLLIIFFVSSGLFWQVESPINDNVSTFGDAFYFTVVALTTVGFGDIIPVSETGRWITILMIFSGIILIPWQVSRIAKEWIRIDKKTITCSQCGLQHHEKDASHCKSCGKVIFQEYEGN
jgi:voltage-gated potassium channel